jgi:hypothetical protein
MASCGLIRLCRYQERLFEHLKVSLGSGDAAGSSFSLSDKLIA